MQIFLANTYPKFFDIVFVNFINNNFFYFRINGTWSAISHSWPEAFQITIFFAGSSGLFTNFFFCYLLEMGTPEQVTEEVKKLLDICMPGGGYIFDCNGSIDIAKEENIDAMYNALLKYGSYK